MNSFYGGLRGPGVVIKETVSSASDLNDLLNISYGEYVFVSSENSLYRKTENGYEKTITFKIDTSAVTIPLVFSDYDTVRDMSGSSIRTYSVEDDFQEGSNVLNVAYAVSADNKNYIGLQLPAPSFNLISSSPNLTIEKDSQGTPFNQTYTFSIEGGGGSAGAVSALTDFRSYIIGDDDIDIYDPNTDTKIDTLEDGTRVIIYQKTTSDYQRWYLFGLYNGFKSFSISATGLLMIEDYNGNIETYNIKNISSVSLDADILTVNYNDGTDDNISMIYPKSLAYDTTTAKITVTNSSGVTSDLSPEINYIQEAVVTEDYHLIIFYSSPSYREAHKNYTYQGSDEWIDYGSIRRDIGILIGKNILLSTIATYLSVQTPTRAQIISYLNTVYPNGLTGEQLEEKLVSVGNENEEKEVYGFDYTTAEGTYAGWYYVGRFSRVIESVQTSIYFGEDDGTAARSEEVLNMLNLGGIWFVTE